MIVDSHCHLDRLNFDELGLSLEQVLENARAKKVEHFLCVSVTLDQFPGMLEKVQNFPDVSVSCGVHPLDQKDVLDKARLLTLANNDKVVAIGETGLDYYYSKDTHQVQKDSFAGHIDVANELNKPLIIHTRDAKQDTLDIMRAHNAEKCGGVLHCFTEDWEMAKQALDLGLLGILLERILLPGGVSGGGSFGTSRLHPTVAQWRNGIIVVKDSHRQPKTAKARQMLLDK